MNLLKNMAEICNCKNLRFFRFTYFCQKKYTSFIIENFEQSEIMILKMLSFYKVKLGIPDNNVLMAFYFHLLKDILIFL